MRLSIDIPDELHRDVKVKAARESITIAEVVRRLLSDYVGARHQPVGPPKVYERHYDLVKVEDKTVHVPPPSGPRPQPDPPPPPNFVRPISKEDQAKGRSRK